MIYIWYTGLGGKSNQSNIDIFLWHCTNWQAENMKIYQFVLREEQYVYIWCYNLTFSSLIISNPFKLATTFCLKLVYIYTLSYNNPYLYLTLLRTYYVFKDYVLSELLLNTNEVLFVYRSSTRLVVHGWFTIMCDDYFVVKVHLINNFKNTSYNSNVLCPKGNLYNTTHSNERCNKSLI